MIESFRTWMLLRQLRSHVRESPHRLKPVRDALFRETLLHAYEQVAFYRRYWDEAGFNPQDVRGTQDLERVPIMTNDMARRAATHDELLAGDLDTIPRTFLFTTGSSGHRVRITRGRREERLWRAQGLRIWFEHGFHWRDKKVQLDLHAGTSHCLQRLGVSRTQWISIDVPVEELRDSFLEAKADWVFATPTVLRRLARAIAAADAHLHRPRVIVCYGELVDGETKDLSRQVFGLMPVDVYTTTEIGFVAWQCERCEGLHVSADTHLVEVLRDGKAVRPGELGRIVVTDLRNRAMPFLRYDTGDLAIAGNGTCGCGRQFPCLRSIEGRQRHLLRLKDGRLITSRALVEHMALLLAPDDYRLYQDTASRFRLELSSTAGQPGSTVGHDPPELRNGDVIEQHLQTLLGEVQITIKPTRIPRESGEKSSPIVVNCPAPID